MTTKTIKSYALFAMVPLLLAGFGGIAFAASQSTSYSADTVEDALNAVGPYVTTNDNKLSKIDVAEAKKNRVSNVDIKIGIEYLTLQNKVIRDIHNDSVGKMTADQNRFTGFFDTVRDTGLSSVTTLSCNYNGPHSQPSTIYTGSYSTVQAAINDLPNSYDEVSGYAAAFDDDWHDWVSAYGCADGIFRYQSSIVDHDNSGDFEHRENHSPGEPNPEVLEYGWPVWWWGGYVWNWHN